jgi:predicted Na+-dependent transporter
MNKNADFPKWGHFLRLIFPLFAKEESDLLSQVAIMYFACVCTSVASTAMPSDVEAKRKTV